MFGKIICVNKMKNKTGGFTLIELIIAISVFAVLAIMTIQIFSNIAGVSRKVEVQEYVFSEAEAAMERIIREIQRSAIDYGEYYSMNVLGSSYYGQNGGAYKATFYDPGSGGPLVLGLDGGDGIDGTDCGSDTEYFFTEDCEDFDAGTYDSDTGRHYYSDSEAGFMEDANAFCESVGGDCYDVGYSLQDELYLISADGYEKVMFARELNGSEYVISSLSMYGSDVDGDAVYDYWGCATEDDCFDTIRHYEYDWITYYDYPIPESDLDLQDGSIDDVDFLPMTPSDINIVDLHFYISPLEDPYMGFAETESWSMQHPHVIVVMTVAPSSGLNEGLLGEDWTLTLQGTASTSVFNEVPSEYKGGWRWE